MNAKERLKKTLAHQPDSRIVIDFGSSPVTGIHVLILEKLRAYYGLEKRPIKVTEPYQMLGEVDEELRDLMGTDVIGINGRTNIFGFESRNWKPFRTFWGQDVLVPGDFITSLDENGDLLLYPEGDPNVPPSAKMPRSGFFFDALIRQEPVVEQNLRIEDNLEEFKVLSMADTAYWEEQTRLHRDSNMGILANFGGTALGDIALVPAPFLKHPKGIRDIQEWYMSTLIRPDFLKEIFDRQSDIALENLSKLYAITGQMVDVIYMCGTDFGTQHSTFCDPATFRDLYLPYYRKMNDWIHANTHWKTFKHSCGAVETLVPSFIEAGFDILNPVQINAAGMDPVHLKREYGKDIVFWGGGVDTQKVLAFGSPHEVSEQVKRQCDILGSDGGFVFNTVHNIQANVPVENVLAMIDTLNKINGRA